MAPAWNIAPAHSATSSRLSYMEKSNSKKDITYRLFNHRVIDCLKKNLEPTDDSPMIDYDEILFLNS